MSTQYDSKGELRAAHFTRELKTARHSVPEGGIGMFMRVTLAVIFIYLLVFSYTILGIVGPVLISVLFLGALLTPLLYHATKAVMDRQRSQAAQADIIKETEVRQEG